MAISPKTVQELREKTGVGMMECKRALEEAGGDMEEAVKILRKKGIATAAKKSTRAASDGLVGAFIAPEGKAGSLVEVNCETDFVAKTEDFQSLVTGLCRMVAEKAPADVDALLAQPFEGGLSVKDTLVAKVAKLGENIQLRRFERFQGDLVASYIHAGGKIGVLMEIGLGSPAAAQSEEVKGLVKDLCMQVAASAPRFVNRADVSEDVLQGEREIYRAQVIAAGKPEAIADKIVDGKMNKFFEEACLVEQPFVRDTAVKVQDTVKARGGEGFAVKRFVRFVLGEGLKSAAAE
jgi:elongation factor Ts